MKQKNNSEQAKRNRNNRSRGSKWEKSGADYLDMDVVPYSGSNARFGYGDVRDSIWLGEFKNMTPNCDDKIIIKSEWIDKNDERAYAINHFPFLACMISGTLIKFVILDKKVFEKFGINYNATCNTCIVGNRTNIILKKDSPYLEYIKKGKILLMFHGSRELIFMNIGTFKHLINNTVGMKGEKSGVQGM